MLDFANGAVGTIVTSFDVWAANLPRIEIYGTAGSLSVPDPNTFGGPVRIRRAGDKEWREVPLTHGLAENSRGWASRTCCQGSRPRGKRGTAVPRAGGAMRNPCPRSHGRLRPGLPHRPGRPHHPHLRASAPPAGAGQTRGVGTR